MGERARDTRRRVRVDTGLYRRRTAQGEIRYDVVCWQGGRQVVRTLPAGTSEREARKAALRARAAATSGRAAVSSPRRFAEVADEYLAHAQARTRLVGRARMSETTVELYRSRLRDYVLPVVGARKLADLDRRDVLRVLDRCHAAGLAEWSSHGVLVAFRAVLRYARERDELAHDPFYAVPRSLLPAQQARSETRALRPEEASLLLRELREPSPPPGKRDRRGGVRPALRDYALGCLLVDAGLRLSEALGLRWGDVELVEGVLHVRGQLAPLRAGEPPRIVPPKLPRSVRTVPLLPRLREALEELYAGEPDEELVLRTRRGTPLSRYNASRSIREAARRAKLGHVTPHVLRRTTGTALSEARVPEAAAAAFMGHSLAVFHAAYVKAHRDAIERERARQALVELGFGVTPT
jgi:integrase